ncbi:MAG: DUF305 domain-containing protein, partial [Pseudomonadota bacterium]
QQQFPVTWPAHPVVALAYLDQAARRGDVAEDAESALRASLAEAGDAAGEANADLADQLDSLAEALDGETLGDLRDTVQAVAAGLRG